MGLPVLPLDIFDGDHAAITALMSTRSCASNVVAAPHPQGRCNSGIVSKSSRSIERFCARILGYAIERELLSAENTHRQRVRGTARATRSSSGPICGSGRYE